MTQAIWLSHQSHTDQRAKWTHCQPGDAGKSTANIAQVCVQTCFYLTRHAEESDPLS